MDDYIKREDAINARNEYLNETVERDSEEQTAHDRAYAEGWNACNNEYLGNIKELPSEDVAPVRHGRWEKNDYLVLDTLYRCSVCGEEFYIENGTPQENQYYYCPNCGATMDGESDDE